MTSISLLYSLILFTFFRYIKRSCTLFAHILKASALAMPVAATVSYEIQPIYIFLEALYLIFKGTFQTFFFFLLLSTFQLHALRE